MNLARLKCRLAIHNWYVERVFFTDSMTDAGLREYRVADYVCECGKTKTTHRLTGRQRLTPFF